MNAKNFNDKKARRDFLHNNKRKKRRAGLRQNKSQAPKYRYIKPPMEKVTIVDLDKSKTPTKSAPTSPQTGTIRKFLRRVMGKG